MTDFIRKGHYITVSNIDGDWSYAANTNNPTDKFKAIKWFPGAGDDKLTVKETSDTGPTVTVLLSGDGEGRVDPKVGELSKPLIDFSECVISAGAKATFVLE